MFVYYVSVFCLHAVAFSFCFSRITLYTIRFQMVCENKTCLLCQVLFCARIIKTYICGDINKD